MKHISFIVIANTGDNAFAIVDCNCGSTKWEWPRITTVVRAALRQTHSDKRSDAAQARVQALTNMLTCIRNRDKDVSVRAFCIEMSRP
jgi:hypothetical protein